MLTEYVVLRQEGYQDVKSYQEVWRGEAHSTNYAVKAAVAENGLKEGTFVAVPTRSFQAVELTVETVQKIRIRGVKGETPA
jgi:hypothetical protein